MIALFLQSISDSQLLDSVSTLTTVDQSQIDTTIVKMAHNLGMIEYNTHARFLENGWNLMALCALVIAIVTMILQWASTTNIGKTNNSLKVSSRVQIALFRDLIRHLYRNKVCTLAMRIKWERKNEDRKNGIYYYPSEEHLLKLKVLPSDIHFTEYNDDPDKFDKLHNLELLLRNYNVEIETAILHLQNPTMDQETQRRDFDTLDFKTGYLCNEICKLAIEFWGTLDQKDTSLTNTDKHSPKDVNDQAIEIINQSQDKNVKKNEDKNGWGQITDSEAETLIKAGDFSKLFKESDEEPVRQGELMTFLDKLATDVKIELGKNSSDSYKIHMIPVKI